MGAKIIGTGSLLIFFFMLAFSCLLGYALGGFFGIGMIALGYMAVPITLLSVNLFAGMMENAHRMATIGRVFGKMRDDLYKMAWAARNYSIFTQVVAIGGLFLTNTVILGIVDMLAEAKGVYVWDS